MSQATPLPYTTLFRSRFMTDWPRRMQQPENTQTLCRFFACQITKTPIHSLNMILLLSKLIARSEEHTSELQSRFDIVCRLLLEKKKNHQQKTENMIEY